jgi:hypothetical protein
MKENRTWRSVLAEYFFAAAIVSACVGIGANIVLASMEDQPTPGPVRPPGKLQKIDYKPADDRIEVLGKEMVKIYNALVDDGSGQMSRDVEFGGYKIVFAKGSRWDEALEAKVPTIDVTVHLPEGGE